MAWHDFALLCFALYCSFVISKNTASLFHHVVGGKESTIFVSNITSMMAMMHCTNWMCENRVALSKTGGRQYLTSLFREDAFCCVVEQWMWRCVDPIFSLTSWWCLVPCDTWDNTSPCKYTTAMCFHILACLLETLACPGFILARLEMILSVAMLHWIDGAW
jgi:hypothetical protein